MSWEGPGWYNENMFGCGVAFQYTEQEWEEIFDAPATWNTSSTVEVDVGAIKTTSHYSRRRGFLKIELEPGTFFYTGFRIALFLYPLGLSSYSFFSDENLIVSQVSGFPVNGSDAFAREPEKVLGELQFFPVTPLFIGQEVLELTWGTEEGGVEFTVDDSGYLYLMLDRENPLVEPNVAEINGYARYPSNILTKHPEEFATSTYFWVQIRKRSYGSASCGPNASTTLQISKKRVVR